MTRPWFRTKRYGWGWTPATIQGWLVLAAFVGAVGADYAALLYRLRTGADFHAAMVTFFAWMAVLVVAILAVCWIKGERPRWRWGD